MLYFAQVFFRILQTFSRNFEFFHENEFCKQKTMRNFVKKNMQKYPEKLQNNRFFTFLFREKMLNFPKKKQQISLNYFSVSLEFLSFNAIWK